MLSLGKVTVLILFAVALVVFFLYGKGVLTFNNLTYYREALLFFVEQHYILSAAGLIVAFISTAFFVPGAIILSLAGGLMFGAFWGTIYVNIGATLGATLAFLTARYLMGGLIQKKFEKQLKVFNNEIAHYGNNYLLTLRVVPVLPFFIVNYLAGITRIPLSSFIVSTFFGILPGSIVYAYAGRQIGTINAVSEIFSLKLFLVFLLMAFIILLPVLIDFVKKLKNRLK